MDRITTDLRYTLVQFCRSWQTLFFAFVFPLLFLILAWYMVDNPSGTSASYLDYAFPGIIGIAVMGSSLDLTVGFIAGYRATGVLRKLAVTPLSRLEWNLSRALAGITVALASSTVSLAVGWLAFGIRPEISLLALLLVIAGSVMFVGLGIVIACLIRDGDTASAASFTLTLPLITISGSLFPTGELPGFLQTLALASPLTYLNDGLRSATTAGQGSDAILNLAIVAMLGLLLFGLGAVLLNWRDA